MESIKQKEEMQLAEARRLAATKIASMQRGKQARRSLAEEHRAATKLQAAQRGKASRNSRFVLADAQHKLNIDPLSLPSEPTKLLTLKQLGLKSGLPQNPVPDLRFLTFQSWWTEMGTKRYMELCFDMQTELFQVILDKTVQVLDPKLANNPSYVSYQDVISQDTKVMSMRLHEKLSGNQHAESMRRESLQCWDLHVGCRLNVLGRPTSLMQCNLVTGQWLDYHADRLQRIKAALEESLRKYETIPMAQAFSSNKGKTLGSIKGKGTTDLRTLFNQIEALSVQLRRYRPNHAAGLMKLADSSR